MSSTNGSNVYDAVMEGHKREVCSIGGSSIGVSIPKEVAEEHGIEQGDGVVITADALDDLGEDEELTMEVHFG